MNDDSMYPMFLNLRGRSCVVVGGDKMIEEKVRNLLDAGARIRIIAPEVTPGITEWVRAGCVQWENRDYRAGDLHGAFLVVTDAGKGTNAEVYEEAEANHTFCNAVDDIEHCNCYAPAVVRRGALQLAISTAGNSPALAQRLRRELEQQIGPQYLPWVKELGAMRRRVFSKQDLDPPARRKILQEQASAAAFESFCSRLRGESSGGPPEPRATREVHMKGKVCLVGAGPGDPELLTVKAVNRLACADVVLHDALISPEVLARVSPSARVLNVGKRCGKKCITQQEINSLLVNFAASEKLVVRLKSGDPMVFGRGGEELDALRQADVEVEIVPGITAAVAAAASVQMSLTDRRLAERVLLVSAHHAADKAEPNWRALISSRTTLAVYMPGHPGNTASILIESGLSSETPCILISKISRPDQESFRTNLGAVDLVPALPPPSLLIVGEAVATSAVAEFQPLCCPASPEKVGTFDSV